MRVALPFRPLPGEARALALCADALADYLGPCPSVYHGTLAEVDQWLQSRCYPLARRRTLMQSVSNKEFSDAGVLRAGPILAKSKICAFVKNEGYKRGARKPPRLICARDDAAKMLLGPLFQPLDDLLFHSRFSVKHLRDD